MILRLLRETFAPRLRGEGFYTLRIADFPVHVTREILRFFLRGEVGGTLTITYRVIDDELFTRSVYRDSARMKRTLMRVSRVMNDSTITAVFLPPQVPPNMSLHGLIASYSCSLDEDDF